MILLNISYIMFSQRIGIKRHLSEWHNSRAAVDRVCALRTRSKAISCVSEHICVHKLFFIRTDYSPVILANFEAKHHTIFSLSCISALVTLKRIKCMDRGRYWKVGSQIGAQIYEILCAKWGILGQNCTLFWFQTQCNVKFWPKLLVTNGSLKLR